MKSFIKKLALLSLVVLLVIGFQQEVQVKAEQESVPLELNNKVAGVVAKADDKNVYEFTVVKEGYFEPYMELTSVNTDKMNFKISLYDEKNNLLYFVYTDSDKVLPKVSFQPGKFKIVIENSFLDGIVGIGYNIGVKFEESTNWEQEYNDTFDTARKIDANKEYMGNLHNEKDKDYYKFTLEKPGHLNITFDSLAIVDIGWDVYFYDHNFEVIYREYGVKGSMVTPEFGLASGDYYVQVYKDLCTPVNENYKIKVNYTQDNTWEAEGDESFDNPNKLKLEQPISGSLYKDSDTDYYKLSVPTLGTYNIKVNLSRQAHILGFDVDILDSKEKKIGTNHIINNTTIKGIKLKKGTYYVKVSTRNTSGTNGINDIKYTLTATLSETEKNNSIKTANTIPVLKVSNKSSLGSITGKLASKKDIDFYKFTVLDKKKTTIVFSSKAKKAWKIVVMNTKNKEVASFSQEKSTTSKTLDLAKGNYYIKVLVNGKKFSSDPYTIAVSEISK